MKFSKFKVFNNFCFDYFKFSNLVFIQDFFSKNFDNFLTHLNNTHSEDPFIRLISWKSKSHKNKWSIFEQFSIKTELNFVNANGGGGFQKKALQNRYSPIFKGHLIEKNQTNNFNDLVAREGDKNCQKIGLIMKKIFFV